MVLDSLPEDSESQSDGADTYKGHLEEPFAEEPESMGESIFALATASLIRDWVMLKGGSEAVHVRVMRMAASLLLVVFCVALQFFLLYNVYNLLCKKAVKQIRNDYSTYEFTMYGANHSHLNKNGFYRGEPGFLNDMKFHDIGQDERDSVCQIPLAHVDYLFAILLIWTLTCAASLRNVLEHTVQLMIITPTVSSVSEVFDHDLYMGGEVVIRGLTCGMKLAVATLCLLPRLIAVMALNFLGCRWLLATNSLGDVLLNGLALEFLLVLKNLLYEALTSKRNKRMTENTKILPLSHGDASLMTCMSANGALIWALVSVVWVYLFIYYVQSVLPGYLWDVAYVCQKYPSLLSI
ncbi:unnamed protein product [Polarella glacialis]|uniref:Uncharacterized protein n=1 Tax=Polarella glacialis TaxID=89957 RepID=A0A813K6K9_POLGL|nr:unnamed protein product [Polarella glacialis]